MNSDQHHPNTNKSCYLCGGQNTEDFFTLPPIPTMDGVMSSTKEEALNAVRGQIQLRFCHYCGYVGNEGYDPTKVSFDQYDFSNAHSPIFIKHTAEISERLKDKYNLYQNKILDVGCGDGYFLKKICEVSESKGIGIDPGFDFSSFIKNGVELEFIRDYYTDKYHNIDCDLVTCRHVLSVINDPIQIVDTIRKNLDTRSETIAYFDAPYVQHTFGDQVIWNVVYENRSWFGDASMKYLLERYGFDVLQIYPCWQGEYLAAEAKPRPLGADPATPDADQIQALYSTIQSFTKAFDQLKTKAARNIQKLKDHPERRIMAWGAGARAISFFNLFNLSEEVDYIVDINTKRQGKYLPGTGQSIVTPEFAADYQPDLIIITNPTYEQEIKTQVSQLGLSPDFWVI
jgi:SAM-dependent methyltransferase